MKHVFEGPNQYWSPDLQPSRGQLAAIAHLAGRLLGLPPIANRLEASIAIARLHAACEQHAETPPVEIPDF